MLCCNFILLNNFSVANLQYDVKGKHFMVHILWQRLLGKKVVLITNTDEHEEEIADATAVQGSNPSDCDVI